MSEKEAGVGKYVNLIPSEVITQLRLISDEMNHGLIMYLLCEGDSTLPKMSKDLKVPESVLKIRLENLMGGALVNGYLTGEGQKFTPTLSAKQLMYGLLECELTEEQIEERLKKYASK